MKRMSIDLLIFRNKARLEKLIREDAEYKKILAQSKRLDQYVVIKMQEQLNWKKITTKVK